MHITLNKMEDPKQAYCDNCDKFATWWTSGASTNVKDTVHYLCDNHAVEVERIANDAQTLVEWVE